jgi:hypothetical protein
MKNAVFWDVTTCGSVRTEFTEELSASIIRVTRIGELGTLAVTSNRRRLRASVASYGYVPSIPILVTLMMDALSSSETSVLTRGARRNIPRRHSSFFINFKVQILDPNHTLL